MKILALSLDANVIDKDSAVAKRMVAYGQAVDLLTVLVPSDSDATIRLHPNVTVVSAKKSNKIISLLRLKKGAEALLRREKYNVMTVQDAYYAGFLAWVLARRYRCALEAQVHGFEKFSGLRKLLARFVLRRADAVRTVSERMKKMLVDDFGVSADKVTVVPIQVKIPNYKHQIPKKSQETNSKLQHGDPFVFLTVGRLVPVKNVGMQIEALAEVVKMHPEVELWIAGDGEESNTLKAASEKLGIKERIKFLGWQNDLEKFYNQADAFVLTSNSEGWGMAVVEAAAHGLPIIMTDVGLAGEVIKNGENGLVVPVGDTGSLIQAMRRSVEDEALRRRLGIAAQAAVERLPDEAQTLALYRKSWENAVARAGR